MLTYLIDGFNLFHQIGEIKNSNSPRSDLIQFIRTNRLVGSSNNKIIIVFDGHQTPDTPTEREYKIVFSNDRSADDVIKERISKTKNKRQLIVVSDDREIRDYAKMEGAISMRIQDFLKRGTAREKKRSGDGRDINPSKMIEITEELKKIWVK
jgi:predicted RNA-binding protein with PIN domain